MTVWYICIHCERAFSVSLPDRRPARPDRCPFDGCNGDTFDLWEWIDWIEDWNMPYPNTPIYGVKYPLYPSREDIEGIQKLHKLVKTIY